MEQHREEGVWSRVAAQPRQELGDLRSLLRESAALAAIYRRAAETMTGQGKVLARKLLEEELAAGACLRGIGILQATQKEQVPLWEPGTKGGRGLLEGCYHRTRRCLAEYTARSVEPEYGTVFRHLADRAAYRCCLLAQLLGTV